ncbi:MAG TPA: fumarylacetoacetate hydrolase family protein [Mycobacterium sp.]|nr:fumarylacetoacetate hydrolase family protein [Mycobacterium sp.]
MRIANIGNRLNLVVPGGAIDVEKASDGLFSADPAAVYDRWAEFRRWVESGPETGFEAGPDPIDERVLGAPSPRPRQVFSIGANYPDHAAEADFPLPEVMEVFCKFPSSITGPNADVPLPKPTVDWEAELVVIIGSEAHRVSEDTAWGYVAGVTAGQDYSERERQMASTQWGLAKSYPAFGPTGPWLVTADELPDPDDIEISCTLNGELVQHARTSRMIYSVPQIVAELSTFCTLYPGDVIFTGTMSGVGLLRKPPCYLKPGDVVVTEVNGVGLLRNTMVAGGNA